MNNRERQQQDSMKIIVWTIFGVMTLIVVILVLNWIGDIVNYFFPPFK